MPAALPRFAAALLVLALAPRALAADAAKPKDPFWNQDAAAALRQAKSQDKDLVVDFTSTHCGCCRALEAQVFNREEFRKGVTAHFVPAEVWYEDSAEAGAAINKQNDAWHAKYGIHGWPTVMLMDGEGRPYAEMVGCNQGSAQAYLQVMEECRTRRIVRDEQLDIAAHSTGEAKAKALDAALSALKNDDLMLRHYKPEMEALITAASAGPLRMRYEKLLKSPAVARIMKQKIPAILAKTKEKPEETVQALQAIANDGDMAFETDKRQIILFTACRVCLTALKDSARAEKLLDAAVALDPQSETGKKLAKAKGRIFQEAVKAQKN